MTTIAYRADLRQIAWDSQVTTGGAGLKMAGKFHKVWSEGDFWIGGTGSLFMIQRLQQYLGTLTDDKPDMLGAARWWAEDTASLPSSEDNHAEMFVVFHDSGRPPVCLDTDGCLFEVDGNFALGSGREYALAAMHMGASAELAVDVATCYDIYSGGPIHSVMLAGD